MIRKVINLVQGYRTQDGAGVSLVRVLGNQTVDHYDPILMLDSFDSSNPDDYRAGFPKHPHRGIETFSFIAEGQMVHQDHLGNKETVTSGGGQWLTAGSGVFHAEMIGDVPRMLGVQVWLNLPKKDKMCPPAYHSINAKDIEEIALGGAKLRLVAGQYEDHEGYKGKYLPLDFYDIHIDAGATVTIPAAADRSVMVFTLVNDVYVSGTHVKAKTAAKLGEGDQIELKGGDKAAEVLYISSKKLDEPVSWYGPIVMNTMAEIRTAINELNEGTFIKKKTDYLDD